MSLQPLSSYRRAHVGDLLRRLNAPATHLIIVAGPRQVGKTTLVRQALIDSGRAHQFLATDNPDDLALVGPDRVAAIARRPGRPADAEWLIDKWNAARALARADGNGYVMALDEIQKIPRWSDVVKGLWDADRAEGLKLHVVLLGSSPLLMQHGMTESLAGRFELIRATHWSFLEMYEAFNFSLDDYLFFGGYPGSAPLIRNEMRRLVELALAEQNKFKLTD